ncbi:MAG TPA: GTP cyclohydrolase, FolE2/MptA family [Spongiibacteraceae bacterium]|nr:GTP cyclohydrolase, FolE2/MptA family [Spongiibacteraceae bacterium]
MTQASTLPDTQNSADASGLRIPQAGILGLVLPARITDSDGCRMATTATWKLAASVPVGQRGTHMSRFVQMAHRISADLVLETLPHLSQELCELLETDEATLAFAFTAFIDKPAPVSGIPGTLALPCDYKVQNTRGQVVMTQRVSIPATSLCPCSKAISSYGAHNQRAAINIVTRGARLPAIDLLRGIADREVSSPVYSLLKREDEKHVTERAYENPKFVEDMARGVYASLTATLSDLAVGVTVISYESIHNHEAWAHIGLE